MDQQTPGQLSPGDLVTIAYDNKGDGIWWPAELFEWCDGHLVLAISVGVMGKLPADRTPALVICCERSYTPNTQRICVLSSKGFLAVTWIQFVDAVYYMSPRVVHDPNV